MTKHFLQSDAWKKFQDDLSRTTIQKNTNHGEYLGIVERGRFNNRLYLPYGPQVDSPDDLAPLLSDIKKTAQKLGVDFIRIEPMGDFDLSILKAAGYKRRKDLQPSHTVINDVSISRDAISAAMSQTARRMWRKNLKAGVTFEVSYQPEDINLFIDMIHDVSKRTGMVPHSDKYFRQMATSLFPDKKAGVFLARLEGQPIASIVFFSDGITMSYAHAASYSAHRKLSPATALGAEILLLAHETGHKYFDFYGIAPENATPENPWHGFTQFKKIFGGEPTEFAGTWELPLRPITYTLYSLYQNIRRHLRHR